MYERTVFESMSHNRVVSMAPHASVLETAWAMTAANCGSVLITDPGGAMLGILTEHDLLTRERKGLPDKVPSLLMVDADNVLQKVLVDERLIRQARRCRDMWHSLQELGGIHNSHAEKLLAREKMTWEERLQHETDAHAASVPGAGVSGALSTPTAPAVTSAPVEKEPERSPDEAYIETPRCSTCNECTTLNNKLFSYDDNKQAYIADIHAGSYAQLVEAAESCQVSIIHPGKPLNLQEPGLDELLKRAAAFQ